MPKSTDLAAVESILKTLEKVPSIHRLRVLKAAELIVQADDEVGRLLDCVVIAALEKDHQ